MAVLLLCLQSGRYVWLVEVSITLFNEYTTKTSERVDSDGKQHSWRPTLP